MKIQTTVERWPLQGKFTISRGSKTEAEVVHVSLSSDGYRGVGECVPYARYGESTDSVVEQITTYAERHGGMLDQQKSLGADRCSGTGTGNYGLYPQPGYTRSDGRAGQVKSPSPATQN